jgi:hypothetical protein
MERLNFLESKDVLRNPECLIIKLRKILACAGSQNFFISLAEFHKKAKIKKKFKPSKIQRIF